ncbi:MAG: AfsR/SARP family transcriptional regulator [Solirubrobacterales bacterium]
MLGGFGVAVGDRKVPESAWRLRKAKSLIKLVALAPDRRVHRERAAELLWPDRTADSAANNLHQALYVARRALEAAGADALECLALRDDMLVLSEERPVEIDATEFESAAEAARAAGTIDAYRSALALYGGELLPEDRYEDWAASRRQALGELHLALLLELAERHADAGDPPAAIETLQRAIVDDPLHEGAHRRLMKLFTEAGRRQQALAQYQQLRQTLRREYEADPDPETRALFQEILSGRLDPEAPADAPAETRPPGARRGPASEGAPARHNLPVQLTSFIGRERAMDELRRQLDRSRLLTLTGPGGAGKTRLALEVAGERLRYYDGVWLVELAALADPGLAAQETAVVLGMQLRSRHDANAALARLIGDRRLLLVLDNCEHLIGACARLAEELLHSCPGLTILATSREPLRIGGEVTVRVPSLRLPDPELEAPASKLIDFESIRLFCERAADAAPGFRLTDENARPVAEVCFRLDGMPLAIELAAARAGVLTPAQTAERLRDSLDLLGAARGRLTRQQTLAATVSWSHDLLTGPEQALFRRTGVFAGSFGLDAVEDVCGGDGLEPGEALEHLGRLVDKSLITAEEERGEYRYRLLETIRHYARGCLDEAAETARVEHLHRAFYLAVAEAANPEAAGERFFERAEIDLDNLRAALASGLSDDPRDALRIAVALWPLWMRRGYFAEGSRWLDAALAADFEPTPLRAQGLVAASALDVRLARPERLVDLADQARDIHSGLGDSAAVAGALLYRGVLESARTHYSEAAATLSEAFDEAQRAGAVLLAAEALHVQGVGAHCRGRDDDGRRLIEQGLGLLDDPGDSGPSVGATTIGLVIDRDGRGQTQMYFEDTLILYREVGPGAARGYMLCDLALVARAQGDYESARAALDRALALHRERDDQLGAGVTLNALGNLARSRAQFDLGREWLEEALSIRRAMGDRRATGMTLGCLGLLAGRAGDLDEGRSQIGRALAIFAETDDGPGRPGMLLNLGNLELEAGEVDRALPILDKAAALFRTQMIMRGWGWPTCALAEALISATEPNQRRASDLLEEVRGEFRRTEDARGLAHAEALEGRLARPGEGAKAGLEAR